ncbi:MAG TPA: hypothetical protein EYP35_04190 [Desulfobacterales bacterium]|nr:hypothetical protein [Desulfobacterales bacterium]HIP39472.1 hypothetical protein [Desulfocapsa sulfexigens]
MAKYFQISAVKQIFAAAYLGLVPGFSLENTNIPGYDELSHGFDFNRLRAEFTLEHDQYPDIMATVIVDNETLYRGNPGTLTNDTSIYRAYLEYSGASHYWVIGKQRIPLGVGKFWNPIDVFNPINIQAIESNERPGTETIRYEYAINELSNIDVNIAKGKGSIRVKGYLAFADVALIGEWDEKSNLDIQGWEIEGELADTGIELRSEGGSFHNRESGRRHSEFILGAEYGFANSLVLLGEYHYLDALDIDQIGLSASFIPAILWTFSVLSVTDLDDGSGFISPVLEYSLSDEMTLSAGAFFYHGPDESNLGVGSNRFYLHWFIHF